MYVFLVELLPQRCVFLFMLSLLIMLEKKKVAKAQKHHKEEVIQVVLVGEARQNHLLLRLYDPLANFNDYVPTNIDHPSIRYALPSLPQLAFNITYAATASSKEYNNLRGRIIYPGADVVLLCFSLHDRSSLESASEFFFAELKQFIPDTPIILVGAELQKRATHPDAITTEEVTHTLSFVFFPSAWLSLVPPFLFLLPCPSLSCWCTKGRSDGEAAASRSLHRVQRQVRPEHTPTAGGGRCGPPCPQQARCQASCQDEAVLQIKSTAHRFPVCPMHGDCHKRTNSFFLFIFFCFFSFFCLFFFIFLLFLLFHLFFSFSQRIRYLVSKRMREQKKVEER
ncbi:ras small GTPase RAC1 [Balamuthia mandrillaris]